MTKLRQTALMACCFGCGVASTILVYLGVLYGAALLVRIIWNMRASRRLTEGWMWL